MNSCRFTHGWRTVTALRSGATIRSRRTRCHCTADAATILPKASIIVIAKPEALRYFPIAFGITFYGVSPYLVDLDMVLLRPLNHASPYLFGWESPT